MRSRHPAAFNRFGDIASRAPAQICSRFLFAGSERKLICFGEKVHQAPSAANFVGSH
jgi:hypothetical protein